MGAGRDGDRPDSTPAPDESQSLRYAATEMLNNAIGHSRGTAVRVGVTLEARTTVVTIEDDGIGVAWIVDNLAPDTAIGPSDVRRGTRVRWSVRDSATRSSGISRADIQRSRSSRWA